MRYWLLLVKQTPPNECTTTPRTLDQTQLTHDFDDLTPVILSESGSTRYRCKVIGSEFLVLSKMRQYAKSRDSLLRAFIRFGYRLPEFLDPAFLRQYLIDKLVAEPSLPFEIVRGVLQSLKTSNI